MTDPNVTAALAMIGVDPAKWWESLTLRGLLVMLAARGLEMAGVELGHDQLASLVGDLLTLVGAAMTWYGRVRSVRPIDTRTVLPGVKLPE